MNATCARASTYFCVVGLVVMGCKPTVNAATAPRGSAEAPPTSFVIATGRDIHTVNPAVAQDVISANLSKHLFMNGVTTELDCSLRTKPGLYTGWEWSTDSRALMLTLRDDIRWSDGTPVTSADVTFAYSSIAKPMCMSPRRGHTLDFARPPLALGPHKVRFTWNKAGDRTRRLIEATGYHLPEHALAQHPCGAWRSAPVTLETIGDGPFRLGEHRPQESFTLVPNPDFTGPDAMRPRIDRIEFRVIPNYADRLAALKAGDVHMVESIAIGDVDDLQASNQNLRLVRRGYRHMDYVGWNLRDPRFADVRVRRAFAHAVNIESMLEALLTTASGERYGKPAVSTFTPELCDTRPDITPITHDVQEAARLLAAAGWTDTDEDGLIDKDGKPFRFTLMTHAGNARRVESLALIQGQLREVGVIVDLELLDVKAMMERVRRKDYEAMLSGWSDGLFPAPGPIWRSGTQDTFNYTGYNNPRVDALIDQGMATSNPREAAPLWKELQSIIYQDQPYLFLFWRDEVVAIDKRIKNANIDLESATKDLETWELSGTEP